MRLKASEIRTLLYTGRVAVRSSLARSGYVTLGSAAEYLKTSPRAIVLACKKLGIPIFRFRRVVDHNEGKHHATIRHTDLRRLIEHFSRAKLKIRHSITPDVSDVVPFLRRVHYGTTQTDPKAT